MESLVSVDRECHPSSGREELSFIKNVQESVHYGEILILKPKKKKFPHGEKEEYYGEIMVQEAL